MKLPLLIDAGLFRLEEGLAFYSVCSTIVLSYI